MIGILGRNLEINLAVNMANQTKEQLLQQLNETIDKYKEATARDKLDFTSNRVDIAKVVNALKETYGLDPELEPYDMMEQFGRIRHLIKKGNEVDDMRAAIELLKDWHSGKLML